MGSSMPRVPVRELAKAAYKCRRQKDFKRAAKLFGLLSEYFLRRGDQSKHLAFEAHKIECEARLLKENRQFDLYVQKLREAENIWHHLDDKKNATWCKANIEMALGTECLKAKRYEEAIRHYNESKEAYLMVGQEKPAKFCEAYSKWAEASLLEEADPRTVVLLESAASLFREAGVQKEAVICETDIIYRQGVAKFKEALFQEAKEEFLKAAKMAEELGSERFSSFYRARAYECDYRVAKLNGDLNVAMKALEEASQLFQKAWVEEAYFVSMGDLHRLRGFYEKSQGRYKEAIECFHKARDYYLRAAEVSERSKSRHERSANYIGALITSTEADYAMCFEHDIGKAANLYLKTALMFKELGDESTASFNTNIGLLLKAVIDRDTKRVAKIAEALYKYYALRGARKLPSLIHNIFSFISTLATLLMQQQMWELREEDAGFNFEARVRELIGKFDGRSVPGSLLGSKDDRVVLHKYEEVQEKSFEPEDDEVDLVFNDKSTIEVDALAVRRERGRRFILVCECKYRSRKPVSVDDLELLERKAKFIEVRYGKISRLAGEPRPIVEEKWFVTTGRFGGGCVDYAKSHNIRLIGLKELNNLMEEFGLRRILGPRPEALES